MGNGSKVKHWGHFPKKKRWYYKIRLFALRFATPISCCCCLWPFSSIMLISLQVQPGQHTFWLMEELLPISGWCFFFRIKDGNGSLQRTTICLTFETRGSKIWSSQMKQQANRNKKL